MFQGYYSSNEIGSRFKSETTLAERTAAATTTKKFCRAFKYPDKRTPISDELMELGKKNNNNEKGTNVAVTFTRMAVASAAARPWRVIGRSTDGGLERSRHDPRAPSRFVNFPPPHKNQFLACITYNTCNYVLYFVVVVIVFHVAQTR